MILATFVLLAQTTTTPFNEAIDVRLHNVDAIVTDAKGNHVPGLREEDFEILEDGAPQDITNFAEYSEVAAAAPLSESGGSATALLKPPARKFVLFIDEMNMHPVTRKKFTDSVNKLLERALRDGDEAMIVRPTTADKLVLKFTGDRAAIRAAVAEAMDAAIFRADSPKQLEDRQFQIELGAGGGGDQRQVASRIGKRVRRRIEQRLGNIRAIVASLAEEPGRKVVITVMEALPAMPGREFFRISRLDTEPAVFDTPGDQFRGEYIDLTPVITEIARIASSKGITVYALQPEFEHPTAPGTVETKADTTGGGRPNLTVTDQLDNTETSLNLLTEITGGKWFRGDTRVADAFQQVTLDVQSYYSLAYHGSGALDQARKVEVRVKNHPELHVRTRGEVVRKSPRRELNDRVVASLVYPPSHNGLGIALEEGSKRREGRRVASNVDVLVPLGKLFFTEQGGVHRARFTVHYAVAGERTDFVNGIEPEQLVEIPDAEWKAAQSQHWRHSLTLNVRKGTPHRVAIGVLDSSSQEWGIEALTISAK